MKEAELQCSVPRSMKHKYFSSSQGTPIHELFFSIISCLRCVAIILAIYFLVLFSSDVCNSHNSALSKDFCIMGKSYDKSWFLHSLSNSLLKAANRNIQMERKSKLQDFNKSNCKNIKKKRDKKITSILGELDM